MSSTTVASRRDPTVARLAQRQPLNARKDCAVHAHVAHVLRRIDASALEPFIGAVSRTFTAEKLVPSMSWSSSWALHSGRLELALYRAAPHAMYYIC